MLNGDWLKMEAIHLHLIFADTLQACNTYLINEREDVSWYGSSSPFSGWAADTVMRSPAWFVSRALAVLPHLEEC